MGGAAGGEIASQAAVSAILTHLRHARPACSAHEVAAALVQAVRVANTLVFERARRERSLRGMGCTATVAALVDRTLLVAQIGDSRAYVMRERNLAQVTRDQTLAQQLLESGQLRPEDLPTFEYTNVILQALGTSEEVMVDLSYVDLAPGDVVLLCSDGLHGQVSSEAISRALEVSAPAAAARLVDLANAAGGVDNVTCVVARFALEPASTPVEMPAYRRFLPPDSPESANDESKDSSGVGAGSDGSIRVVSDAESARLASVDRGENRDVEPWRVPVWLPLVLGMIVIAVFACAAPWW
jgi:protein phosphatase